MAAVVSTDDIGSALVKVVAIHVVNIAVVVIVDTVSGDFAGVDPHVGSQVGMVILDTLVLDADHHIAMAFFDVPGFGQVDVGIHRSAGLASVVVMPLFAVARVVWSPAGEAGFHSRDLILGEAQKLFLILGFSPLHALVQTAIGHHDVAYVGRAVILEFKPQMQSPFDVAPAPFKVFGAIAKERCDPGYSKFQIEGVKLLDLKAFQASFFITVSLYLGG